MPLFLQNTVVNFTVLCIAWVFAFQTQTTFFARCRHCLCRLQVKSENPGIAFTDVARVMGEKWKNIDPEEKKEFEEQAAKDKIRYQQQMADYKANKAEAAAADSD